MKILNTQKAAILAAITMLWIGFAGLLHAQTVTTVAGGYVGNGGKAINAAFNYPVGVAEDQQGNYYVSDLDGHRIRMINGKNGKISTIAGTGIAGFNGDGILASAAQLNSPAHIQFDPQGDLVVSDSSNCRVRKIDSWGIITTIAGNGTCGLPLGNGGAATSATLGPSYGIAYDNIGNLYISDYVNNVVRVVDTAGMIHPFAGNGTAGFSGNGGPATSAQLHTPIGMVADAAGNIYIAESGNNVVRKVDTFGIITPFAGLPYNGGFSGEGEQAASAAIGKPRGLAFQNGAIFISNAGAARIRSVDINTGIIQTYAGSSYGYDGDGNSLTSSQFARPSMIIFNSQGDLVVADTLNGRIREGGKKIFTLAGGYIGDGSVPTSGAFQLPEAVAFDSFGGLYIADSSNNRVRRVDTAGTITTVAGDGNCGYSGDAGLAASAELCFPQDMVMTSEGVYVADSGNLVIRKVNGGIITTYAGSGQPGYNGDALAALKTNLDDPIALAADRFGTVFELDDVQLLFRKIQ